MEIKLSIQTASLTASLSPPNPSFNKKVLFKISRYYSLFLRFRLYEKVEDETGSVLLQLEKE